MKLVAQFDGGCSMGKGIAAGAAVLFDPEGEVLKQRAKFLRAVTTPIAEYTALHLALIIAAEYARSSHVLLGDVDLVCWGDAELIVRHVDGRYQCRKPTLQPLLEISRGLMKPFGSCEVKEFPKGGPKMKRRYSNEKADALASKCMMAGEDIT